MNVFILDKDMEKSAQMLDDAHLIAQINEATQILMANYNKKLFPDAKIGHVSHPVTMFYSQDYYKSELFRYLSKALIPEYKFRFGKEHQSYFWCEGFYDFILCLNDCFYGSKTYVNGHMTDNIEEIRQYIMTKPHKRPLKWTNRKKPDWWEV